MKLNEKNEKMTLASKMVKFIETRLHHTGDYYGVLFTLEDWQEDYIRQLFKTDEDDTPINTRSFLLIPRCNGKTELQAAILCAVLFLLCNKCQRNIYSAAGSREQAGQIFDAMASMIRQNRILNKLVTILDSKKLIRLNSNRSTYRALSKDSGTPHGLRPFYTVIEEVHTFPNTNLYSAIIGGMAKCKFSMLNITSTAGIDKSGLLQEEYNKAKKHLNGTEVLPNYLPVIFESEDGCGGDWHDKKEWYKANPALGKYQSLKTIEEAYHEATLSPASEWHFRTYHLNQMFIGRPKSFINEKQWMACEKEFDKESLKDVDLLIGVDLSRNNDFSSVSILTEKPDVNGNYYFWSHTFVPYEISRRRMERDKKRWLIWDEKKLLTLVGGKGDEVFNHQIITDFIVELGKTHNIKKIGADPAAGAGAFLLQLRDTHGFDVGFVKQSMLSLSPATKQLEYLILSKKLIHDGNEFVKWQMSNCEIRCDAQANIMLDKSKDSNKFDTIAALVNCVWLTLTQPEVSYFEV